MPYLHIDLATKLSFEVKKMTQRSGDENYLADYIYGTLRGALGVDWTPDEVGEPLRDATAGLHRGRVPVCNVITCRIGPDIDQGEGSNFMSRCGPFSCEAALPTRNVPITT
jgi:hypothetical protein